MVVVKNIIDSTEPVPERVECGISFIDKITSGGFVCPGSYLVTGDSNAGKTTLLAQVADGITANGNIAFFNSLEMIESSLNLLLRRLKLKHGFLCSFERDPVLLMEAWRAICKEQKDLRLAGKPWKHVVLLIDSLQSMGKDMGALNCVKMFDERGVKFGSTVIWIGQATKSGKYRGSSTLQHEVSGHMHLSVKSNNDIQMREISMEKHRAGKCQSIHTELGEGGHVEIEISEDDF